MLNEVENRQQEIVNYLKNNQFARVIDLNKDGSLSLVKQEKKGSTVYVKSKASFAKVKAFLSRMEAVN